MNVPAVRVQEAGNHPRSVVGILRRIHRGSGSGEVMPAIVNLEQPVAVSAVADDVVPGICAGAAGLLSSHCRQQFWINTVTACRRGNLRRVGHSIACQLSSYGG